MRTSFFNWLVKRLCVHPSKLVDRLTVQILANITADAFKKRKIRLILSNNYLEEYALFTKECAKDSPNREYIWQRAYRAGEKIRHITGVEEKSDVERLVFLLYRNIRIEMCGSIPGEILVKKCFFSSYYTPEICGLMSIIDSGIMSGIRGGGVLTFNQRITEGASCCRAEYVR